MSPTYAALLALDLGRVLALLPAVERGRTRSAPGPLLERMRARGRSRRSRSESARRRLLRAIAWVDRFGPGGPNCLRRTLLRVALDPESARGPIVLGLDVREASGHAWVEGAEESGRYDVEFRV